jgi:hypothetical protein
MDGCNKAVASPEGAKGGFMPKFIIERNMPGAGKLTGAELHGAAQKSCDVLRKMGPETQWVQSFVTDDRIYCVYIGHDEAAIRRHAELSGFPANRISEVRNVIDPTTAD